MDEKKEKPEKSEPVPGKLLGRMLTAEELQALRQAQLDAYAILEKEYPSLKIIK